VGKTASKEIRERGFAHQIEGFKGGKSKIRR
jgi:hypothetical protein